MADKIETKAYKPNSTAKCNDCIVGQEIPKFKKGVGIVSVDGDNFSFRGVELPDGTGIAKFILGLGILIIVITHFFQSSHQDTRKAGWSPNCNPSDPPNFKRLS